MKSREFIEFVKDIKEIIDFDKKQLQNEESKDATKEFTQTILAKILFEPYVKLSGPTKIEEIKSHKELLYEWNGKKQMKLDLVYRGS